MALVYLPEKTWSTRYGPEYFTVAIVAVQVHEDRFAQYKLLVQNGKRHWFLLRRFSEFATVRSRWGLLMYFPPKTLCCRDLNPEYLARRKHLLQDFLGDLLVIPHVAEEKAVRDFLQLQSSKTFFV